MRLRITGIVLAIIAVAPLPVGAVLDPTETSLEELLGAEVTSASRKSQRLAEVPAAVYVITAKDIERSGATSLPEALRLAPGVDAVRISSNRWAVSIRGFTDRFANKLLVLIDGRSAYSPAFSGVFWESQLVPLHQIERIEVVRGPGAAVWGTNAVNGVINIITRGAAASSGTQARVSLGTHDGASADLDHGDAIAGESGHYRVHVGARRGPRMAGAAGRGDAHDQFEYARLGGRMDLYSLLGGRFSLSGSAHESRTESDTVVPGVPPMVFQPSRGRDRDFGFDLRALHQLDLAGGASLETQLSLSRQIIELADFGSDRRTTADLDLGYRRSFGKRHELSLGASYRFSSDYIADSQILQLTDNTERVRIASLYVQDEIRLADGLSATLGARIEDHEFAGSEFQPTARLMWNVTPFQSAWLAFSRAQRTPSRGERSFNFTIAFTPEGFPIMLAGSESLRSERLRAAELGHRIQVLPGLYFDTSLYLHDYEDLRTTPNQPPLVLGNGGTMVLQGAEFSMDWRTRADLSVQISYAFSEVREEDNVRREADAIPRHLASLRVGWQPRADLDVDLWLRHVADRRVGDRGSPIQQIDAFWTGDLRLGWRVRPRTEVFLAGFDLLEDSHAEFVSMAPAYIPTEVRRRAELGVRHEF